MHKNKFQVKGKNFKCQNIGGSRKGFPKKDLKTHKLFKSDTQHCKSTILQFLKSDEMNYIKLKNV